MKVVLDRSAIPASGGWSASYKLWPAEGRGVVAQLPTGHMIRSEKEISFVDIVPRVCGDFYAEVKSRCGRYVAGIGADPAEAFYAAVGKLPVA
jgi:hypothetical protein